MEKASILLVVTALVIGMAGCSSRPAVDAIEIRDWYDLAAISNNMTTDYILMNDLDATTDGWEELASPTANEGKGWKPIAAIGQISDLAYFTGVFDGQGHEIKDLFINRPDEHRVGLFHYSNLWGVIRNIGVVNANVTGDERVGGLVGQVAMSTVSNSYCTGTVTGNHIVGGLVGGIWSVGAASDCYFVGSVSGDTTVGGLAGYNVDKSTVSDCYSSGNVTGIKWVGGLVGENTAIVENCYSDGNVIGEYQVGGLIGRNNDTVIDSYSTSGVTGGSYIGGLVGINAGSVVSNSYATGNVTGDDSVGGVVGLNQHYTSIAGTISNCYSTGTVSGSWDVGGVAGHNEGVMTVSNSYSTGDIIGESSIGGLVGLNAGNVSDSYSTGAVSGNYSVGGLVGWNDEGAVSNSYSIGAVFGNSWVGGLVGDNYGTVSDSFWDTETSGQATSDGGIGRNTMEMQDITTFSGAAAWNITAVVNPSTRNLSYIWNIVDDETYPFLSWQP